MKHTRKLYALLLALTLVLSLAGTAFAEETPLIITVKDVPGNTHTLNAYQIFKGDQTDDGSPEQLVNIEWGNGVNGEDLLTALKREETFQTNTVFWFKDATTAREVADILGDVTKFPSNSPALLKFTELVKANKGTATILTAGSLDNNGRTDYTATVTEKGYYMVIDECTSGHELITGPVAMMEVVGDFTVNFKGDSLDLTKEMSKVETVTLEGDAKNHKDVEVGDTITYTLKSKVPYLSADYKKYVFKITDTMSKGLTFGEITEIKVGETALTACNSTCDGSHAGSKNVYHLTTTAGDDNSTIITIDFPEMLSYGQATTSPKSGDEITVTYTAKVNADALTVDVESNSAKLTFSKTTTGDEDGETTEKKTYVSEINLNIKKTDGGEGAEKKNLPGAQFVLYQKNASGDVTFYKETKGEDGTLTDITWETVEGAYQAGAEKDPSKWNNDALKDKCTIVTTDENGLASFQGLDAGTYYLHEVKAPDGYNALLGDIEVTLGVTWADGEAGDKVPTWTMTYKNLWDEKEADKNGTISGGNGEQNVGTVEVVNKSGTELPSTGGVGTTIFYIAGGALALAALILLVTKKRMTR